MINQEKSNFTRNLIFMLLGFFAVFGLLAFASNIQGGMNNRPNSVTIKQQESQYLKVSSGLEEFPELSVLEKPKQEKPATPVPEVIPSTLLEDEVKVIYLGSTTDRDTFRITECHVSVDNCLLNGNINLTKISRTNLVVNKNYIMKLRINSNKQIAFLSIRDN